MLLLLAPFPLSCEARLFLLAAYRWLYSRWMPSMNNPWCRMKDKNLGKAVKHIEGLWLEKPDRISIDFLPTR